VSVSSDVVQNYGFNIVATGTDSGHTTHSAGVVFNSTFDFAINNDSARRDGHGGADGELQPGRQTFG